VKIDPLELEKDQPEEEPSDGCDEQPSYHVSLPPLFPFPFCRLEVFSPLSAPASLPMQAGL